MRSLIAALTVLGFLLTAGGLVAAYVSARCQVNRERERVASLEQLTKEEIAEQRTDNEAAQSRMSQGEFDSQAEMNAWSLDRSAERKAKYDDLHSRAGSKRVTWENQPFQAANEAVRIAQLVLVSARTSLVLAGVGLVVSTATSVWALFI